MLLDPLHNVIQPFEVLRHIVRDLHAQVSLDVHHQLHFVERVELQLLEGGVGSDVRALFRALELVERLDELDDSLGNVLGALEDLGLGVLGRPVAARLVRGGGAGAVEDQLLAGA